MTKLRLVWDTFQNVVVYNYDSFREQGPNQWMQRLIRDYGLEMVPVPPTSGWFQSSIQKAEHAVSELCTNPAEWTAIAAGLDWKVESEIGFGQAWRYYFIFQVLLYNQKSKNYIRIKSTHIRGGELTF